MTHTEYRSPEQMTEDDVQAHIANMRCRYGADKVTMLSHRGMYVFMVSLDSIDWSEQ